MHGPAHYRQAEHLVETAATFVYGEYSGDTLSVAQGHAMLTEAQVHATLALAAAVAVPASQLRGEEREAWWAAAGFYRAPREPGAPS